jgi:peptide/nickel transport system ATP-binding protein
MAGTGKAHLRDPAEALLRVEDLTVEFPAGRRESVKAVSGISLDALAGETVGLVGESGCGKSTTGRAILQLPRPRAGSVVVDGTDLTALRGESLRGRRTDMQMIFQDPIASLNPRRTVRELVAESAHIWRRHKEIGRAQIDELLDAVGLNPATMGDRRPHELSGGQCQRVCIARALLLKPRFLLCDEPVSALDVSVQAQVLNLLEDLKQAYGLTILLVAHDLAVVKRMSDRVIVMYLSKTCEIADPDRLFSSPAHPYTALLLSSIPELDVGGPSVVRVGTELPSAVNPPSGCRFRTRCPRAADVCATLEPEVRRIGPEHYVACHFPITDASAGAGAARSARSPV